MNKKIILGIVSTTIIAIVFIQYFFYKIPRNEPPLTMVGDSPHYKDVRQCPSEAQEIINKYGINKEQIEGCQLKSFYLSGQTVGFVHLEFGEGGDCLAGCFFEHYCAVIESGQDYPYAFYLPNKKHNFLNSSEYDSRYADKSVLTGKNHQLASSTEFITFLEQESRQGGEFRWCKN